MGKFLAKRGPGLHHVAYQVEDIEATLRTLRDAGLRLIDETPRTGIRQSQVAFLHPSASGGVLTEIVQPAARCHCPWLIPRARRRSASPGGQVLSLRLSESQLTELRSTLREGRERWHEVEAADGAVLVDVGQVVYLRVESDEHRVGF